MFDYLFVKVCTIITNMVTGLSIETGMNYQEAIRWNDMYEIVSYKVDFACNAILLSILVFIAIMFIVHVLGHVEINTKKHEVVIR